LASYSSISIGLAIFAGLTYLAVNAGLLTKRPLGIIYGIAALVVALGTFAQGYVYHQAFVQITGSGLIVTNYSTLFAQHERAFVQ
jgi:hypothetical protein